jgi:hypothetical protein
MNPEEKVDYYLLTAIRAIVLAGCLMALVILIDYLMTGKAVNEPVAWKKVELTGRRGTSNYAYRLYTAERSFYCERDFFIGVNQGDTLTLSVSPWFSAVNTYASENMPAPQTFSLRYATGIVLPLVTWLVAFLGFTLKKNGLYYIGLTLTIVNFIALIILI